MANPKTDRAKIELYVDVQNVKDIDDLMAKVRSLQYMMSGHDITGLFGTTQVGAGSRAKTVKFRAGVTSAADIADAAAKQAADAEKVRIAEMTQRGRTADALNRQRQREERAEDREVIARGRLSDRLNKQRVREERQEATATSRALRSEISRQRFGIRELDSLGETLTERDRLGLPSTPQSARARAAMFSARSILHSGDPDAQLRAQKELLDHHEDIAQVEAETAAATKKNLADAKELSRGGGGLGGFSERFARAMLIQRGVQMAGNAVTQGILQESYTSANGGTLALGGLNTLGSGLQTLGAGRMIAGKGGGVMLAGGAVLSALATAGSALGGAGGSMVQGATRRASSFAQTYGLSTMVGPTGEDYLEQFRAAAKGALVFGDADPHMSGGGAYKYDPTTWSNAWRDATGYAHTTSVAGQAQADRIFRLQLSMGRRAALRGRNADQMLTDIVQGAGGVRLSPDDIELAFGSSLLSGVSGAGAGGLLAHGRGGGSAYAINRMTRAFQGFGLDPAGVDAATSQMAALMASAGSHGLSQDSVGWSNVMASLAGAGVDRSRMMNVPNGFLTAAAGAKNTLGGGFAGLQESALLVSALRSGGDIFSAMSQVSAATPEQGMSAMRQLFGDYLTTGYYRSQGLSADEASRYMGGAMGGLPGSVAEPPAAAYGREVPELLRAIYQLMYADSARQLEAARDFDKTMDGIKGGFFTGIRSILGVEL